MLWVNTGCSPPPLVNGSTILLLDTVFFCYQFYLPESFDAGNTFALSLSRQRKSERGMTRRNRQAEARGFLPHRTVINWGSELLFARFNTFWIYINGFMLMLILIGHGWLTVVRCLVYIYVCYNIMYIYIYNINMWWLIMADWRQMPMIKDGFNADADAHAWL